ncbi:MAG: hypothetical protein R2875_07765 [Desulfobacterales bacterium]
MFSKINMAGAQISMAVLKAVVVHALKKSLCRDKKARVMDRTGRNTSRSGNIS